MALFVGLAGNLSGQRASQAAASAAMAIGAAVFVGWNLPPSLWPGWDPGAAAVKPTTALCLMVLGFVLVSPGRNSRLAFVVGLAVIAIAALDLLDRLGIDSGINLLNRLLVPRTAATGPDTSFRMINGVPVALALCGCSLALSRFERYHFFATVLASLAGITQVFAFFDYLGGVHRFYASLGTPTPLTSIGVLCVVVAIVLRIEAMPALRKPRPLWHLLTVLGGAIIAPLLLFGLYTGLRITDAQLHEVRNELMSEARVLSANVDREIVGEIERLQALAASASMRQGDFAEVQRQAEASLAWRRSGDIVVIDRNMQELVNTWAPFGTPLGKAAVSETSVNKVLATGKPQVSGLFNGAATGRLMVSIIVPVRIDGENRFAVARSPNLHALAGLVASIELPPGWQAAISDSTHRIIVASDQQDAFMGKELPPAQSHRTGLGGVSEFVDSEGRPSLEAYTWSPLTGWETAVWAPTTLLEAPVRALWLTIGVAALMTFTMVVIMASWLGRLIARSVGYAAQAAVTLGKGGPLPTEETPVVEIDTLMGELRGAAAQRQAAEHDLQASKDRLQFAMDAARLGSFQYDPLRGMFAGDARVKEIFDFDAAQDEISIEELAKRIHPDDVGRFWTMREAALNPADAKPYAKEYRIQRRGGQIGWVEILARACFEGTGPRRRAVSFVGTAADITERKEREEKEHLLMREINHRAKNMLSVVDAIAHQTATRNPEDFIERFSKRIQALSANQDLLVRNEWSGVEIADLVRAQLAHFVDLIGSRITLQGPQLRLTPASAQAIGLALHELATNAGKYGALSTDKGRVDVSWGTTDNTLTMRWAEHEGPRVSAPPHRGFGSIVIEAMAKRSVAGEVSLDYAPSGVTWRLRCPAANALEPE